MLKPLTVTAGALASSLALVLATGSALAQARQNGPYVGLALGAFDPQDGETDLSDIEFDTGFTVGGQFGYQFDLLRLEAELGYRSTEGTSSAGIAADVDIVRFTGNAYLDLPLGGALTPYVGAGLGGASLSASRGFDDDDSGFTWHGEVGVAIAVTDNLALSPSYRYEWIDTDLGNLSDPLTANVLSVSLRYVFNPVARGVAAAAPAPYGAPMYRPGYPGDYYGSYGSRYYDRPYYGPRYRDYDDDDRPSPAQRERDRCGWDGPGCPDGDESFDR